MNTSQKTKRLAVSAIMLATATVLAALCALVPFLSLPFGGSFTVASMLPLVLIAYMYGTKWGLLEDAVRPICFLSYFMYIYLIPVLIRIILLK